MASFSDLLQLFYREATNFSAYPRTVQYNAVQYNEVKCSTIKKIVFASIYTDETWKVETVALSANALLPIIKKMFFFVGEIIL